jgi:hypothetical protein
MQQLQQAKASNGPNNSDFQHSKPSKSYLTLGVDLHLCEKSYWQQVAIEREGF